ncbi:MAG: CoA-binding protein [Alphaproteobacteria bacterium]
MSFDLHRHDSYPDSVIEHVLKSVKTIALVGFSANESRPSFFVTKYLIERGYKLYPINPGLAGQEFFDAKVFATLRDVPEPLDMIDIFRNAEAAEGIVDEALALTTRPKVIWMQLGVRNDRAAEKAEAHGLTVIMNRCPKIEFGRFSGEIGWSGVNTGLISSRKPVMANKGFQKRII